MPWGPSKFSNERSRLAWLCRDCGEANVCPDSKLPSEQCCYAVDTGNEDSASALIRYESGMHASYSQNFFVRRETGNRSIRLMGYKGTIEFEWQSDTVRVMMHHSSVVQSHKLEYAKEPHFGGDRVLAEHFTEMVRDGAAPLATLDDGMLSALMCLKAKQSSEQNRFMNIDWDEKGMDTK